MINISGRKSLFIILSLFISGFAKAESGAKTYKMVGQLEYWTVSDAFKAEKADNTDIVNSFPSSGYRKTTSDISAGLGIRLGTFFPTSQKGLQIGGSLGYIIGPIGDFELNDGNVPPTNQFNYKIKTDFIRLMMELKKDFNFSAADLRLGAGVGFARGHLEISGDWEDSESWTGLTWEVSPSFLIKTERINFDIGLAYSGFPMLSEDENFNRFKWNSLGIKVGAEF